MRTSKDSKLNMNKTIKNQFNLLRIVDNERYPAYFIYNNKKYILKIYEDKNDKN
jgi:methionyl-tRNA formyltransferase